MIRKLKKTDNPSTSVIKQEIQIINCNTDIYIYRQESEQMENDFTGNQGQYLLPLKRTDFPHINALDIYEK